MSDLKDDVFSESQPAKLVGKVVRGDMYFHVSATQDVPVAERNKMFEALEITGLRPLEDFNVVKIARGRSIVSFLSYSDFLDDAFPSLKKVCTVNLATESFRDRWYRSGGNPPILHKKELLLSPHHPSLPLFKELTQVLEAKGIRPAKPGLGFKKQWDEYLVAKNVEISGHKLVELGNDRD